MDSGGYPGMLIPTIKYDNLNGYGIILATDHESQRKIRTTSYITKQLTYKTKKEEGKG